MGHIWDTLGRAIADITKFVIMEKKASRARIRRVDGLLEGILVGVCTFYS